MTETFGHFVTLEKQDRIATVTLDRKDGLNALSIEVMEALTEAAIALSKDTNVSAIVLTGEGAFTAGADLKDPKRAEQNAMTTVERRQAMKLGPDMCAEWEALEQITIAAIERFCIGGGVALAVACDHRIISEDAHLRLPEVPLGMNMSWQTNPRTVALIGPSKAKQFTILGEPCDAETALNWGLVDQITSKGASKTAALEFAAKYAAMPPLALRMTKQAINATAMPLGHATSYMDRDQFAFAATSNDQKEAVRAFLEKREPSFKGD